MFNNKFNKRWNTCCEPVKPCCNPCNPCCEPVNPCCEPCVVMEPCVNKCCETETCYDVKHVIPVHTHVVNKHVYKHTYEPQFSCSSEDQVINVNVNGPIGY